MDELALFAGAGGGILGGLLLGWRTRCAVELDPYARRVLLARQADGCLPRFPIWDDVTTFDGKPWRGHIDVISGGFPCQDISCAGKGAGIDGERSGLWGEFSRIIREVRPRYVFVENSPMLTSRGLHRVLGDLAEMGFDAQWGVLGHDDAGGQHRRERVWIVANSDKGALQLARFSRTEDKIRWGAKVRRKGWIDFLVASGGTSPAKWRREGSDAAPRPVLWGNPDGVANTMDRIAAIGNGQVPAVAALAWQVLVDAEATHMPPLES